MRSFGWYVSQAQLSLASFLQFFAERLTVAAGHLITRARRKMYGDVF
jgi:hypothetical protein